MPKPFQLMIVTPDGDPLEVQVTSVVLPGAAGSLGVQAGHEPWTVLLKAGRLTFETGGAWEHVRILSGVAQIGPESTVVVADRARGS